MSNKTNFTRKSCGVEFLKETPFLKGTRWIWFHDFHFLGFNLSSITCTPVLDVFGFFILSIT